MYSVIRAIAGRGTVRSVFVVALAMALVGALYVPSQAQTAGAATPSWRSPQGSGPLPATNRPGQALFHRPRRAASAQAASSAYTESVLYVFCSQTSTNCTDGENPFAGLIVDASGSLYGTTFSGGSNFYGAVFKLAPNGDGSYTESLLYSFCAQSNCADGEDPQTGLVEDASGNLYGTTSAGGANCPSESPGNICNFGTVFKLTPGSNGSYTESVLYSFCNCTDGYAPNGLIEDAAGNLYGTTNAGGAHGGGTVFKLTPGSGGSYSYGVLYSFCSQGSCEDGEYPYAGLIEDAAGNLFGTAEYGGGTGGGTVFELSPNGQNYDYAVIYGFCSAGATNCTDGISPQAPLIEDASGNLYGTTYGGGGDNEGTVYKLTPSGSGYTETVLYSFCSQYSSSTGNCVDGANPEAGLIEDASGNLYGTTSWGGANIVWANNDTLLGGTAFKLSVEPPSGCLVGSNPGNGWCETVLYNFCSQGGTECWDGYAPLAGLIVDASDNLYGTAFLGGDACECSGFFVGNGFGAVFELTAPSLTPTSTTLAVAPTIVSSGSSGPVVMTATVSPAAVPGMVMFTNSSVTPPVLLGTGRLSDGVAKYSYTPSSLSAGIYSIGAMFNGSSTFSPSASPTQTLTVTGMAVSASPTAMMIAAGQTALVTLTVSLTGLPDSAVSFACSGLPVKASCSFNPQTVTPSGGKSATTTLTITTTAPTSAALQRAGRGPQPAYALLLPGLALGLVGAARGKRTRCALRLLGLLGLLGLALAS
ncbi:MAG: choice-of-anchor tandem repeat GloVer-containing protein, partial [Candidatus Sulfotelmatobacter sp.]